MKKKILVVDDDVDILESIADILEMEGYAVETTSNGDETCNIARTSVPGVILLDLLLSGKEGSNICQELKADPQLKTIPVILMSAHPAAKARAQQAGANDFISKPFELTELLQIIQTHLT